MSGTGKRPKRAGKPKGVYTEKRLSGIAPYKWKPGAPSPNPGGRARQHREVVAVVRAEMDMIVAGMLDIARKHARGEQLTNSDKIASNHQEFLVQFAYGRHAQSMALVGGLDVGDDPSQPSAGGALSALLRAVQSSEGHEALPPPPAEAAPDPRLTEEELTIHPAAVMLAEMRAEKDDGTTATSREILTELLGEARVNELLGEPDVIVVDAAGRAVAPPPRQARASKTTSSSAAYEPAAPAPSPAAEDPAPAPEPPPPKPERPKYSGMPADAAAHMANRDEERERARIAELQKTTYPNGQVPREVAFPPNSGGGVAAPEVINFTLSPGGKIRRC